MIRARLVRNWSSIAQATAIAVALCFGAADIPVSGVFVTPAAATSERDFTEDDVKAATKKVVDERSHDGVFVFRDPKLNRLLKSSIDRAARPGTC
jgi:hypothetical protein